MGKSSSRILLARSLDAILIIRLKALGDIVLSFPVVRYLRKMFPEARIDYLCGRGFEEALAGNEDIDHVLVLDAGVMNQLKMAFELRKRRYGLVLDLLSSPRSSVITWLSGAEFKIGMDVGRHNICFDRVLPRQIIVNQKRVKCYTMAANRFLSKMLVAEGNRGPAHNGREEAEVLGTIEVQSCLGNYDIGFPASALEKDWAGDYLKENGIAGSGIVGIVPAAKYSSKSWPLDNFAELAGMIAGETSFVPLILWGPGEEKEADYIADKVERAIKAPPMGIARLGALISRLVCVVGVDSGPKHLAVIQGIPTLTIFGPTDPGIWDPLTGFHRVLYRGLDCSPCRLKDCDKNECMLNINPGDVFSELRALLKERVGEDG